MTHQHMVSALKGAHGMRRTILHTVSRLLDEAWRTYVVLRIVLARNPPRK